MVLLATTGCLKVDQALSIRKDCSGTYEVNYSISEQAISQIKAMLKLQEQLTKLSGQPAERTRMDELWEVFLDPTEAGLRQEIQKYANYGIALSQLKVDTRNAWRYVNAKLAYKNLADVARADFFKEIGFSLTKNSDGSYLLHRPKETSQVQAARDLSDPNTERMLTPILGGFRVATKINTPGRILKTNAPERLAFTALWDFDFDKDPNAILALQNLEINIVFDGSGLDLPAIQPGG
jgi:hypothetical protein